MRLSAQKSAEPYTLEKKTDRLRASFFSPNTMETRP